MIRFCNFTTEFNKEFNVVIYGYSKISYGHNTQAPKQCSSLAYFAKIVNYVLKMVTAFAPGANPIKLFYGRNLQICAIS
jgi:hypothetical protein